MSIQADLVLGGVEISVSDADAARDFSRKPSTTTMTNLPMVDYVYIIG